MTTPVVVLGATGMVGQRMISALAHHPSLQLAAVAASQRSAGKPYADATRWRLPGDAPDEVAQMTVRPCDPAQMPGGVRVALSALDAGAAGPIEAAFRAAGWRVVSNASAWRMDPAVPLVIPEVNPEHLMLAELQAEQFGGGFILANPNCCAIPLSMALAPLHTRWGVLAVTASTWQAVSGAGYPGESAWDMVGNVHPHPGNEEEKLAIEPLKLLGSVGTPARFPISARCVRVPVADGHLIGCHVRLKGDPSPQDVAEAMTHWTGAHPDLPSCPRHPLVVRPERDRPSPRFDSDRASGMAVTIGRVEACPVLGVKFYALAHNTIRGAAGAAIANTELLQARGML